MPRECFKVGICKEKGKRKKKKKQKEKKNKKVSLNFKEYLNIPCFNCRVYFVT